MKELKQVGRALLRSYEKPETLCLLPSIGALKSTKGACFLDLNVAAAGPETGPETWLQALKFAGRAPRHCCWF